MNRKIVLIDGDVLAYRISAIAEERKVRVLHLKSGKNRVFTNKTEFKKYLSDKNFEYNESDYVFEDIQEPKHFSLCKTLIDNQIKKLSADLVADEIRVYVSGKTNFREQLELPTQYKSNRKALIRPVHLKKCKEHMVAKHDAIVCHGAESDDFIIFEGYKYLSAGDTVIIVTVDKDANAYSGLNLYDYTQEQPQIINVPNFGSLWDTGKKITGNGFIFFCFQWVLGDPVDCYKPSEAAKQAFGEKAAFNLLKDCADEKEAILAVIYQYKKWYPSDFSYVSWTGEVIDSNYKHMLQLYFKCARMKTTPDDDLDLEKFLKEYGIDLATV